MEHENMSGTLPELTPKILTGYCERRIQDISDIENALMLHDYKTIEFIGHRLRGNGSTYGFPNLTEIGENLERLASQKQYENVKNELDRLKDAVSVILN